MFGKKEAQPQKRIDGLIAAGTIVRGDVIFSGGLRIDGTVEGKISTNNGEAGTLLSANKRRWTEKSRFRTSLSTGRCEGRSPPTIIWSCRQKHASSATSRIASLKCSSARWYKGACATTNPASPPWSNLNARRPTPAPLEQHDECN